MSDDREEAPNKWRYAGLNCKMKPRGTGTTHSNRRENSRSLQWQNLEVAEPDPASAMEEHMKVLEKAAKKAAEKYKAFRRRRKTRKRKGRNSLFLLPQTPAPWLLRSKQKRGSRACTEQGKPRMAILTRSWGAGLGEGKQQSLQPRVQIFFWFQVFGKGQKSYILCCQIFGKGQKGHLWLQVFGKG